LVTQPKATGPAALRHADRRQHHGRRARRDQVGLVGEELLDDVACGAGIALGVLVVEDQVLADLESARLQAVDEALARGVERGVVDDLREADAVSAPRRLCVGGEREAEEGEERGFHW